MDCLHDGFKTRVRLEVKSPVLQNHALSQGTRHAGFLEDPSSKPEFNVYSERQAAVEALYSALRTLNYYYSASAFAALWTAAMCAAASSISEIA
jgi:hypothetical protein